MEPQASQKPVMDVTAPTQRAAAPVTPVVPPMQPIPAATHTAPTALAVHEAPKQDGGDRFSAKPASSMSSTPPPQSVATHLPIQSKAPLQATKQSTGSNSIAIVISTLLIMAVLAGLAVVVYLKSQ